MTTELTTAILSLLLQDITRIKNELTLLENILQLLNKKEENNA